MPRYNVYSQNGEDGIVRSLFEDMKLAGVDMSEWMVEFGAHDGTTNSNTRYWIKYHGYKCVMIEPDKRHFSKLDAVEQEFPGQVTIIKKAVGITPDDGLDSILVQIKDVPEDIDLVSIDVDGPDYNIWSHFTLHRPKVVIIETQSGVPFGDLIRWTKGVHHGQPGGSTGFSAMARLAGQKGYVVVEWTGNLVCLREDLYTKVYGNIPHPDLRTIYTKRAVGGHAIIH